MIAIWGLPLLFVVAGRRTQVATWGRQAVCPPGRQSALLPAPGKWRSTNKHWPPTWPTCSSRSGCDADWCGSAADKLSGGIGTLAIAFQIRRWSSQTLMSIVSHYNWWSVVFGRAPERERDTVRDCWEISSMIYGTQREMETVGEWHFWSVLWAGLMESAIPSR